MRDIIEGLIGDAAGESGVTGYGYHVFFATHAIASYRHSKCRGKGSTGMPGAVTIVLAFTAQHKAIQPTRRAYGVELLPSSREQFMDVGLVADIEQQMVFGGVEDIVQGDG